ncbi:MAG: hypothetical protein AAF572_21600 [Cyanobacteria bacterium P01_B01_bin.77]
MPNSRWPTPSAATAISPLVALVGFGLNCIELDAQGALIYQDQFLIQRDDNKP